VATYHETELAELVERVAAAIDGFRSGELSAFDVNQVLFQYSRAAKELWKFCNVGDIEFAATTVRDGVRVDWWERGAPKTR
jgi:hypothetical protein